MSNQRQLKDWLENYLIYTENTEPPYNYRKWVGISTISSCMRRKFFFRRGQDTYYPNMYIVLIGPAGKCRKTTAMKPARRLLDKLGIKISAESITREQLIRVIKNSYSLETITDETGVQKPYGHCSLTVFSPELTVFLGYNNLQLMADLTDWFDCSDKWSYETKGSGSDHIKGVWLNLLGATTPESIQSAMPKDLIGSGLTSRMIFVYEHKKGKTVSRPQLTPAELRLEEMLLNDLEKIHISQGEFTEDESFSKAYEPWYEIEDETPTTHLARIPKFGGYCSRRATHIMKLSMIMNMSRGGDCVLTDIDFHRALEALEEVELQMGDVFSGVGDSTTAPIVARVMGLIGARGVVSKKELLRTFIYDTDNKGMSEILASLEAIDYCEVIIAEGQPVMVRLKEKVND